MTESTCHQCGKPVEEELLNTVHLKSARPEALGEHAIDESFGLCDFCFGAIVAGFVVDSVQRLEFPDATLGEPRPLGDDE
jgi:hypothetical protein